MSNSELDRLASTLHRMFCGCAADDYCDSIWFVLAERAAPGLKRTALDMGAICEEWKARDA